MNTILEQLKKEFLHCQRCPELCKSRMQVVFGSGNPLAQVLFIGEAPGASEDQRGVPFCGMSGKVLEELLSAIGLSREDVFITNTILCRPPQNRNPAKEEVENCSDRLSRTIKFINPKVIVTIGNFATQKILGKTGVTSLHGKVFDVQGINDINTIKVVPVIHPANYLYSGRNPELLEQMKQDFKVISQVISEQKRTKTLLEF